MTDTLRCFRPRRKWLAPLLAWVFLGEWVSIVMAGGILLILLGVIVVQRAKEPLPEEELQP